MWCFDVVQAAKRMVQTMSKGLYSMSTVVQGEKLGQFLDTEMPSMDNLKVRYPDISYLIPCLYTNLKV